VVDYRAVYLTQKAVQDRRTIRTWPTAADIALWMTLSPNERPFVEIVHDESVVHTHDTQQGRWMKKGGTGRAAPKSKGKGIVVSAFITELHGTLACGEAAHCFVQVVF
jgi:hypothetical protein